MPSHSHWMLDKQSKRLNLASIILTRSSFLAQNATQLEHQTDAINKYISHWTKSSLKPTNLALNQLVKGCQMAMHSAALLTKENKEFRAANEKQKRKGLAINRRSLSRLTKKEPRRFAYDTTSAMVILSSPDQATPHILRPDVDSLAQA
ncbi:hypothetical protein PAAG_08258 [Paracoccidioides lutzii Pb01]|uniref:Uncharacterized protein n=1 Tax=Paracoccidioides lutzii (strain ATCC MYA-826 / Pb01) TaxID=502779 RepID=C1HBW7_PARBA|nr:hypothetical protein PAAG_08258 [Paracoccidioides lutzii Pb01]EEH38531.2 hypothetical protein PAAG_08258 [Paracoccidioides lutzii Pb01]